jgi:hypothetical protein
MHPESEAALRDLHARLSAETAALKRLEKEFHHPYFKKRALRAVNDCEEAEIMFLRPLEKEDWRDAQQEMRAIGYADAIFQFAVVQRKELEAILAKYGPSAVVVPYP